MHFVLAGFGGPVVIQETNAETASNQPCMLGNAGASAELVINASYWRFLFTSQLNWRSSRKRALQKSSWFNLKSHASPVSVCR